MSLVSNLFLLFVLAAVLVYYIAPGRVRWIVLLVFSYLYYIAGGVKYVFFILYSTLVIYLFALLIENRRAAGADAGKLKRLCALGLICNFGMLGVVKYTNFVAGNINRLFSADLPMMKLLLPLGISFYTFQSCGYLLDVYWEKTKAERNPLKFALFVSFFPQIMQGPIGNFNRLAPQLYEPHAPELKNISRGVQRIIWGLAKKMILADWAGVFADAIWGDPERFGGLCLMGLLFYGIQLYADFSGAMDVVIGIAELFGITLDENFKRPYLATSLQNFWKRWHVTLGEWMKTYVFYPLSLSGMMKKFSKFSKKKFGRKTGRLLPIALADVIVFLLVGIWHGADWKFVVYGLINGGILAFSELMRGPYAAMKEKLHIKGTETWYYLFTVIRTFLIVSFTWLFDRSDDMKQALFVMKQAFTRFDLSLLGQISAGRGGTDFVPWALLILAVGCVIMVLAGVITERGVDLRERIAALPLPVNVFIWLLLLVMIGMFGCTAAPRGFIYAQF